MLGKHGLVRKAVFSGPAKQGFAGRAKPRVLRRGFLRQQKGFNLFTALVSFILIILAVLLTNSMISSERNTADILSDIDEQSEMQAMADLARADAMQVFNFSVRFQIERWMTRETNEYLLTPDKASWDDIVRDYAIANFGGNPDNPDAGGTQFAALAANQLTTILSSEKAFEYKTFKLELEADTERMREALQKMIVNEVQRGEFFDVIGCENGKYDECLGTFYVNLDVESLSDEDYEKLPMLRVTNVASGRVIKEPILPRGNFRIYVPLRVFKAIAGAKALAHTPNDRPKDDGSYVDRSQDIGLLSARIHNEFEEMKLGLCDPRNCFPRSNPWQAATAGLVTGECISTSNKKTVNFDGDWSTTGVSPPTSYQAGDTQNQQEKLGNIIEERAQFIAMELAGEYIKGMAGGPDAGKGYNESHDGFKMLLGGGLGGVYPLSLVRPVTESTTSKEITTGSGSGSTSAIAITAAQPNKSIGSPGSDCPALVEGTGLYFEDGKLQATYVPDPGCTGASGTYATCSELTKLEMTIAFEELNPKYMVSKMNPSHVYRIKLLDTYAPFTHKYAGSWGGMAVCVPHGPPTEKSCSDPAIDVGKNWTCVNVGSAPAMGSSTTTYNCELP